MIKIREWVFLKVVSNTHWYLYVTKGRKKTHRSAQSRLLCFIMKHSNLDRALNQGHKLTDVLIMDFVKAFDKVPLKMLL